MTARAVTIAPTAFVMPTVPHIPFVEMIAPQSFVGDVVAETAAGASRTVKKAVVAFKHWYAERKTTTALEECSDRILDDIGILRSEIPGIARAVAADPAPYARAWMR